MNDTGEDSFDAPSVRTVLDRVRSHEFHPVDEKSFTIDRTLGEHGIADLEDDDWRIRLLAVRDLVRGGEAEMSTLAGGLEDVQVRYICATALGVLRSRSAIPNLERVVREEIQDGHAVTVRNATQDTTFPTEHSLSPRQVEIVL